MSEGYAIANALSALAASAFAWSSAFTTNRARLNDGVQDEIAAGSSSAQASGQTLSIDLGAAQSLSGFGLLNHNLGSGACTVAITAGTDGITYGTTVKAASTINTGAPYQKDTVLQFPSATFRYWRLTFAHSGTKTLTFGEILALATITTLSRTSNYGAGESERYVLNSVETETGQQRSTYLGGPIRSKTLPFKDLSTSERDELMNMWRATQGGNLNLLYIDLIESTATAASSTAQRCLWGKLQQSFGWTEGDFRLFDVDGLTLIGQGREVGA